MQDSSSSQQGLFLFIDDSLAGPPLAQALRLVDYNAVAVKEQFGEGVKDPPLIQWLGFRGGVGVTADEKAKRQHLEEIREAGIHILWVHRDKRKGMSKKAQLLLLLWVLDPILYEIAKARRATQFLARYVGGRPKYERL